MMIHNLLIAVPSLTLVVLISTLCGCSESSVSYDASILTKDDSGQTVENAKTEYTGARHAIGTTEGTMYIGSVSAVGDEVTIVVSYEDVNGQSAEEKELKIGSGQSADVWFGDETVGLRFKLLTDK